LKRSFIRTLAFLLLALLAAGCGTASGVPKEITVDYAYYSPLSMLIKKKGWMEEEFKADNIPVKWVLSLGSNKALEYLSTDGADFGSSAGSAALLSRANGNAIKAVYIYSKPEWTALVVGKNSTIKSVQDLKGKKVAATKGTDPYIFLLRLLNDVGLTKNDVEIVHLQHPDGRAALERGDVDAWAGLDPHMASSELEQGSKLIVRNADYNTYGFLNVTEKFAKAHPEHTKRVLKVYEKARQWALQNSDELVKIVAEEAKISADVAKKVVGERNNFQKGIPDEEHIAGAKAASQVLFNEGLIKKGTDTDQVVKELIDDSFAKEVVNK
jgi:sulfonate transport system substrate-binding protein